MRIGRPAKLTDARAISFQVEYQDYRTLAEMLRSRQVDHPGFSMADLLRLIISRSIAEFRVPQGKHRAGAARRNEIRRLVRNLQNQAKKLDGILTA